MSDRIPNQDGAGGVAPMRRRGRTARVAATLALMLLGVWAIVEGRSLSLFSFGLPAPGLLPFVFGVLLVFVALLSLLEEILVGGPEKPDDGTGDEPDSAAAIVGYLGVGVCWTLAMLWVGFLASTFAGLFVLVKIVERGTWAMALGVAGGGSVISYLLFARALGIPLP